MFYCLLIFCVVLTSFRLFWANRLVISEVGAGGWCKKNAYNSDIYPTSPTSPTSLYIYVCAHTHTWLTRN